MARTSRKELDRAEKTARALGVDARVSYRATGGCDVVMNGAWTHYGTLAAAFEALTIATYEAAFAR